jgi:hypothetical protein
MARIPGSDPEHVEETIQRVLEAQARHWGVPLPNHLLYARRPSIIHGVRAMWNGIITSGLVDGKIQALINRRVAALNGCPF